MRYMMSELKLGFVADLPPGTIIRPTGRSWTGTFEHAVVIENIDRTQKGFMPLDGEYYLCGIPRGREDAFRVLPQNSFSLELSSSLEAEARSIDYGTILLTGRGPLLNGRWNETERNSRTVLYDLQTWRVVDFDHAEHQEAFKTWQLIATDQDGKREITLIKSIRSAARA